MKLDTVSVAPPGPPAVTLITMSASFNLKMIRMMRTVTLTGSIRGKVTCQNDCHAFAPSTLAASCTSLGIACRPASNMIMMKGIETQASIASMLKRRDPGVREECRIVPSEIARQRGRRAKAVLHQRLADHPAHGDGTEHQRQQENDAKEFSSAYLGVEQQRQSKRNRIFAKHGNRIEDHVAKRVPVVVIVKQSDEIVEAVEVRALERAEVPIQRSDVESRTASEKSPPRR